jgi:hypothetical protein
MQAVCRLFLLDALARELYTYKSYPFSAILGDRMKRGADHRNKGFEEQHG